MKKLSTLLGIALIALSPFFVQAQLLDPVQYEVTAIPDSVEAGAVFEVQVRAEIEGDWHLYSILNDPDAGPFPTSFSSGSDALAIAGTVTETEAEIAFDPNFNTELGWHSKSATFTIPIALRTELQGQQTVNLEVLYQVCDDRSCLPPKTKQIESDVILSGVASQPFTDFPEPSDDAIASERQQFELTSSATVSSESIWGFIWLAITAGLAALLTPCVFPLIPLTVSYFSNQSGEKRRDSGWGQALTFGLSIVFIFTAIGALLALILGVGGVSQFATDPWVNLFIGLMFLIFGVSMLGMFELRLPYRLTNWLNRKSNEGQGVIGTLFMGLTISAVSFSCTAPFVGAILAATTGGDWFFPILGMVAFSAAFATPFVLFAMFPGYLDKLPKSGSWMNAIKVVLGFIILAASVKFLGNADVVWGLGLLSRPLAIAFWIAIFFLAGLYIIGVYTIHEEKKDIKVSPLRVLIAVPFFLFSFYLIPGLLGASLGIWDSWLPARQPTDVSIVNSISVTGGAEATDDGWSSDFDTSLDNAVSEGRPVFIDFTGYTCSNCKAMESTVFPLQNVQQRFDQMEKVKLYTDGGEDAGRNQELQFELTGTLALPTYVILDPESGTVLDQLIGYTEAEKFESFLNRGLQRYRQIQNEES